MSYAQYIREIGRGAQGSRDLSTDDARQLYRAMLDGGVPDLELGAIILARTAGFARSSCRPTTGRARRPT